MDSELIAEEYRENTQHDWKEVFCEWKGEDEHGRGWYYVVYRCTVCGEKQRTYEQE